MSVIEHITNPVSIDDLAVIVVRSIWRGSRAWHLAIANYVAEYVVIADTLILMILI